MKFHRIFIRRLNRGINLASLRQQYEPLLFVLKKRQPQLEPLMAEAIDSFLKIQKTKKASAKLLKPIIGIASSQSQILLKQGTTFMTQLVAEFAEAREALIAMSEASAVTPRFNAIFCLASSTPQSLTIRVLRKSIGDKNPRVRQLAAAWASKLNQSELIPALIAGFSVERNAKARKCIGLHLGLLRDRFFVEARGGAFELTFLTKEG